VRQRPRDFLGPVLLYGVLILLVVLMVALNVPSG
jgi:hypothetical protein